MAPKRQVTASKPRTPLRKSTAFTNFLKFSNLVLKLRLRSTSGLAGLESLNSVSEDLPNLALIVSLNEARSRLKLVLALPDGGESLRAAAISLLWATVLAEIQIALNLSLWIIF